MNENMNELPPNELDDVLQRFSRKKIAYLKKYKRYCVELPKSVGKAIV